MSKKPGKNQEEEPEVDENPTRVGNQSGSSSGTQTSGKTERPEGDPNGEPLREDEW